MPRLNKPLAEFKNFKGLYTKTEAGLVPDNSTSGVFASELVNVNCKDGTITLDKGFTPEDDGSTETTFADVTTTDSYVRQAFSYKRMDGTQMKILWLNDGTMLWYNSVNNSYENLSTDAYWTAEAGGDIGAAVFYRAHADIFERNSFFWGSAGAERTNRWNSATTSYASSTVNTITKQGSGTWTAAGFSATGSVILGGIEYAYTGGAGTTTLTGVTPDPSVAGHVAGDGVAQTIEGNDISYSTAQPFDITFVYQGRLGVASTKRSQILLSVKNNPYDFVTTGVGNFITINIGEGNGPITGVSVYKDNIIVFKRDAILTVNVFLDGSAEQTRIKPLISRPNVGVIKQDMIIPAENEIYYISADKQLKKISILDSASTDSSPSTLHLSDAIAPTMEGLEFNLGRGIFHKRCVLVSCRKSTSASNDTVLEYDVDRDTFYFHSKAVSCWMPVDNNLFFADQFVTAIYKWRDGYDDNTGAVSRLWRSGRHNFGSEFNRKVSNLFAVHMRISENTTVNTQLDYNVGGTLHSLNFDVSGDGSSNDSGLYIIGGAISSSYGSNPYGIVPYGSETSSENDEELLEVIAFKSLPLRFSPYDFTVQFSSEGLGQRGKILSYGFLADLKNEVPKRSLIE